MAVGLFITILLLFHQISSSTQQSVQVDQFTSPNDRDEILSRDRRTLNSKKDCRDTVLLGSCRRELNQTQQELVEARGKICGLETEIECEQKERNDEFTKINSKISQSDDRSTKIGADLKAEIDYKVAEMSRTISARMAQIETDLMGKITKLEADLVDGRLRNRELERKMAETKRKNDDLEAQLNRTRTFLDLDGWSYLAKTASWYKGIEQKMRFDAAEAYCASRKSHLVRIHSQEEHAFVWELAKTVVSNAWFWIGLKRNPNRGNAFEWTDGSWMGFTNWDEGHPDSYTHALLHSSKGKWQAGSPTFHWPFICKRSSQF
ncbi:unnamed protein product, partial [Mesorhabditis belari]|uniref:C-type lectin domain-containing protein n=1 Tax=Mesorhabditis belari TaxID=2138241 RepID=A0AAF3EQH0_9BILA